MSLSSNISFKRSTLCQQFPGSAQLCLALQYFSHPCRNKQNKLNCFANKLGAATGFFKVGAKCAKFQFFLLFSAKIVAQNCVEFSK